MCHNQAIELPPPTQEGEGALADHLQLPAPYNSDDNGEDNSMVSWPIPPFAIAAKLLVPKTGVQTDLNVLIDLGCSRCLISLPAVLKVEVCTKLLSIAMRFKQANGSLTGSSPATHVTEPISLQMGQHWETICFVVIPKMAETMILGLV